jgi:hypothetical protein
MGELPETCRFCHKSYPETSFTKAAHAIPELTGNGTLFSRYECDSCNARFAAFEDDFGKMTLLERIAGQVPGKRGIPSAKTPQKHSRIDVNASGFNIKEQEGDRIIEIDNAAKDVESDDRAADL